MENVTGREGWIIAEALKVHGWSRCHLIEMGNLELQSTIIAITD